MSGGTRPGVAVVITCFNLGRTIEEALDSVLGQTLAAAELLIVDDGSADIYTRQVLARLENEGRRVVRTANAGVSAARNKGIKLTSSPYIVLLDADDVLQPTYLAQAAEYLDNHPEIAFVSCGMESFGANDGVWTPPPPTLVSVLSGGVVHISSMFRRPVWDAVGGFDESLFGHEEVDFWTSVLDRGFVGGVIQEPLLRYRVRRGSMVQRAIQRGAHTHLMEAIYRKHALTVERQAEALLIAKERFIVDQTSHQAHLKSRQGQLEAELHQINTEIARSVADLDRLGKSVLGFGDLRRTSPVSPVWGLDRGMPLDRYYIEGFLATNREAICGRVLEVKDAGYTRSFGGDRVTVSDVLDIDGTNPHATIVDDLTCASAIRDDTYDCFILTQTLGVIYDVRAAIAEAFRVLKPGGVLLCTVPASGRIGYEEGQGLDGDFWRFTEASVRRLFAETFPPESFDVAGFGNVLARAAFLYGLAPHELTKEELDEVDPFFPLVYGIRAVKPKAFARPHGGGVNGTKTSDEQAAVVLMYHRVSNQAGLRELSVLPDVFRAHMAYLRSEGYLVVSLTELRSCLEAQPGAPTRNGCRYIGITFDDGYAETGKSAAPILREFSFPATHFIVGAALDGETEFWWDALYRVFAPGQTLPSSLSVALPSGDLRLPTSTLAERDRARQTLTMAFYTLTRAARDAALGQVFEWGRINRRCDEAARPMTATEVMRLASEPGVTIGAHTENHLWLPAQARDDQVVEIQTTKKRLELLLGDRVTSFSYPYGATDASIAQMVRQAGFYEAVTTEERGVRWTDDPLLLPRIDVGGCDFKDFEERLERAWEGISSHEGSPPHS